MSACGHNFIFYSNFISSISSAIFSSNVSLLALSLYDCLFFFLFFHSSSSFPCQYSLLQTAIEACQKKTHCKFLPAPKSFGGNPCPGIRKVVEYAYKCRPCKYCVALKMCKKLKIRSRMYETEEPKCSPKFGCTIHDTLHFSYFTWIILLLHNSRLEPNSNTPPSVRNFERRRQERKS